MGLGILFGTPCQPFGGARLGGAVQRHPRNANVAFGGPRGNRLYIVAQTSLLSIFLNAHGV